MNIGQEPKKQYDAIVIGTGISGGWAAKELCEKGLQTLVLERGRGIKHIADYPTANMDPWDFKYGNKVSREEMKDYPDQSRSGYIKEDAKHWFVKDTEHPYNEDKPFVWMRGYHVGGKSIMWARQSYRMGDLDFEANKKDGFSIDWPIRYKDMAPWYSYVEKHIGVSGMKAGLPQLPDGEFLPPMDLSCVEEHLRDEIAENFDDRMLMVGRTANITGEKKFKYRGNCQFRNRCIRGCPYGGYFSSLSSTLPAAEETGNMTLRPDSIVTEIIYDADKKKATGVRVIDAETMEEMVFEAKVIFTCASAIASTQILLNSRSDRFPNGLGNDSGELGHNLMDHVFGSGAGGTIEGFEDKYYKGRRPNGVYIPRFQNLGDSKTKKDYLRGFGYQGRATRGDWNRAKNEFSFGSDLKKELSEPGDWHMGIGGFGECLPYHENRMYLNYDKKDKWGLPTVTFDAEYKENELKMIADIESQAVDMLDKAGFKNIHSWSNKKAFGLAIHECGTARMGRDPKTSILNGWNQVHTVPNVFVTDGASLTSSACQNPSLTYMALTARAADYAVKQLKNGNL